MWAAALAAAAAVGLTGTAAHAADPPIAISPDGVTYSGQYTGGLFDGAVIVPNTAPERSVWVRNTGPSGAHLAVAVRDVSSATPEFLDALSIQVDASGVSGPQVGLWAVSPCVTILSGVHLDQGEASRVDVALLMAHVDGSTAQAADARFSVVLTLTSDEVPAPGACTVHAPSAGDLADPASPGTVAPVAPPAAVAGGAVAAPVAPPAVVIPGFTGTAVPPAVPLAPPASESSVEQSPDGEVAGASGVVPNTQRFYQEYFVLGWVVAAVLGGTTGWWILRRQRRKEGQP